MNSFKPVYSCQDVADKYKGVKAMKPKTIYKIGEFEVLPLEVPHNVPNFAFVISHKEIGKVLYATDLKYFPYRIKGLSTMIIEANYSDDIVIEALYNDKEIRSRSENHLEINKTIEAIRNNYSSSLNKIILCHLSDYLSNERDFKRGVEREFGLPVYVASKNNTIEITDSEF